MSQRRVVFFLALALVSISWSGPLVRLAEGVPPLAIALWRTSISTLVLLPFTLARRRHELASLKRRDLIPMMVAGGFLALHFASWITSVNLTTVASSVLLVTTTPIFVAAASALIGERVRGRAWVGIAVAIGGTVLVAAGDIGHVRTAAAGNALALAGAITVAGYLLIGRVIRPRLSILTYATVVYGSCALLIFVATLVTRTPLVGFPGKRWLVIAGIVAGPQLLGHTTFNYLLERIEAAKVTVAAMAEPIGATLIAALLFGEVPGVLVFPGGVLLLVGIAIVVTSRSHIEASVAGT